MKKFITNLMGILALTTSAFAQDTSSFHFSINHLALSVKNVNHSVDFYKKVLSLEEITNKSKIEGIRWLSLGEGKELHLISTVNEPVFVNKGIHLALATAHYDAFIRKLDEMKIIYSDWPGALNKINIRSDGVKQVYLQDPDGYWIEVNNVTQK